MNETHRYVMNRHTFYRVTPHAETDAVHAGTLEIEINGKKTNNKTQKARSGPRPPTMEAISTFLQN